MPRNEESSKISPLNGAFFITKKYLKKMLKIVALNLRNSLYLHHQTKTKHKHYQNSNFKYRKKPNSSHKKSCLHR